MAIAKTLPPLPVRKAPSIADLQAKKAGITVAAKPVQTGSKRTPIKDRSPVSQSILSQRPIRTPEPVRLTVPVTVKNSDGTTTIKQRPFEALQQDARIVRHLVENRVATRAHLAYLCGADETTVDRKLDSLRKRLNTLVAAKVIQVVEDDGIIGERGKNTLYEMGPNGWEAYYSTHIPDQYLPDFSLTRLLNLSSVIARVGSPWTGSLLNSIPAGSLSVGLPTIPRSRIAADTDQILNRSGVDHARQQIADANRWLHDPEYPTVPVGWSLDELTAEQSNAITKYVHEGLPSTKGSKQWVMAGYFFQIFGEHGDPQNLVDFAVPLPHLVYPGGRSLNVMACLVEIERKDDAEYRRRLAAIANAPIGYTTITCFVPTTQIGTAVALRDNWNELCKHGLVGDRDPSNLVVKPYIPINAPNTGFSFASVDKLVPVMHFGLG